MCESLIRRGLGWERWIVWIGWFLCISKAYLHGSHLFFLGISWPWGWGGEQSLQDQDPKYQSIKYRENKSIHLRISWLRLSQQVCLVFFFQSVPFSSLPFSFPFLPSSPPCSILVTIYWGPTVCVSGTVSGATDVCRHSSCPQEAHSLVGRVDISLVVGLELQESFQTCFQKVFLPLCWCCHIYL